MKAYVGRTLALRYQLRVMARQVIRRRRSGDQLDSGTIRKLDVVVTDAVRVKAARLDVETQAPVGLSGLLEVLHYEGNVVEPHHRHWSGRKRSPAGLDSGQRKQGRGDELPPVEAAKPLT